MSGTPGVHFRPAPDGVPVGTVPVRVVCAGLGCPAARGPGLYVPVTAESWTPCVSRIADVPDLGWCVFAARQLSAGFGGEQWRAVPRRGNGAGGGWRACSCRQPAGSPGRWSCDEAVVAGIVPWRAFGVLSCARGVPPSRARDLLSGLCWSACCPEVVRGCPCDPAAGSPQARTYSGQRRCG